MAQNVKSVCDVLIANVKSVCDVTIANVKTLVDVDNTSGGGGSVAFDGEAVQLGSAAPAVSLTITGKTTAGSDRCGMVSVGWFSSSVTISGVTWDGVAMSKTGGIVQNVDADVSAELWQIVNPPTTASNIVVTFSGSTHAKAVAHSYNGVNQSAPTGTAATNKSVSFGAGSPITVTATTGANEIVVDSAMWTQFDTIPPIVGANQTQLANQLVNGFLFALASRQAGSDGGVMSWTYTGNGAWATVAASLKPV